MMKSAKRHHELTVNMAATTHKEQCLVSSVPSLGTPCHALLSIQSHIHKLTGLASSLQAWQEHGDECPHFGTGGTSQTATLVCGQ